MVEAGLRIDHPFPLIYWNTTVGTMPGAEN